VQVLIQAKAELNVKNGQGYNPLQLAAINGHPRVIHTYFLAVLEGDLSRHRGEEALRLKATKEIGRDVMIAETRELAAVNAWTADPDNHEAKEYIEVMEKEVSVLKDRLSVVRIGLAEVQQRLSELEGCLHDAVVGLDSLDVDEVASGPGQTAMHLAAMGNHASCVHALVKVKCGLDLRNRDLLTPLMIASMGGYTEVVDALIAHGADETLTVDGSRSLQSGKRRDSRPLADRVYHGYSTPGWTRRRAAQSRPGTVDQLRLEVTRHRHGPPSGPRTAPVRPPGRPSSGGRGRPSNITGGLSPAPMLPTSPSNSPSISP